MSAAQVSEVASRAGMLLDASAVLAFLQEEPGHEAVQQALHAQACLVSAANQAEVVAKLLDRGIAPEDVQAILADLGYAVVDVTAEDGLQAGFLRAATRHHGLGLGDRLCLSTAARLGTPVLTADRQWLTLGLPLDIRGLRPDTH